MKPFISYIGSKRFLLSSLDDMLPKEINNFYSVFLGGGSILFYINKKRNINKNYINDLNTDLIMVYNEVKNNTPELIQELEKLNKYFTKEEFKELINVYNDNDNSKSFHSALFIFFSRRSYNSKMNYGKNNKIKPCYVCKKTNIYKKQNIKDVSKLLKKTNISNSDYKEFIYNCNFTTGDFVFLDPPYLVKNVKQYYKSIFLSKDFVELKEICDYLNNRKVNFMVTLNEHIELINLFKDYNIRYFTKKNSIFSNGRKSKLEKEIIITNY